MTVFMFLLSYSEPPRWGYPWPSSALQTLQTWEWKSTRKPNTKVITVFKKDGSVAKCEKLHVMYLIGMLSVKLLYLFQSIVELGKLIWS